MYDKLCLDIGYFVNKELFSTPKLSHLQPFSNDYTKQMPFLVSCNHVLEPFKNFRGLRDRESIFESGLKQSEENHRFSSEIGLSFKVWSVYPSKKHWGVQPPSFSLLNKVLHAFEIGKKNDCFAVYPALLIKDYHLFPKNQVLTTQLGRRSLLPLTFILTFPY